MCKENKCQGKGKCCKKFEEAAKTCKDGAKKCCAPKKPADDKEAPKPPAA